MPVERDNDAEREARIKRMVRELQDVQSRVDKLTEEAERRVTESERDIRAREAAPHRLLVNGPIARRP